MTAPSLSRRSFLHGLGAVAAITTVAARSARASMPPPAGRAVRFGATAPQGASFPDILSLWQDAEALGFDTAFVYDHFMSMFPGPPASERCFEAWSLLSALAARTERIRLGVLVTGNTYRHPAVVAKMAATVDHVSGGRLILGMGAGWLGREHTAYGIPFHTAAGRARRLAEAVEVIRHLLTEERSTFDGKYYTLKDAPCEPKPLQRPHLPLLIGGTGRKLVLPVAARHAQIWHFTLRTNDAGEVRRVCADFDGICREVGRDPAEIEKATSLDPHLVEGSPRNLFRQVRSLVEAGVRHFILLPTGDHVLLRRFAREIMRKFLMH